MTAKANFKILLTIILIILSFTIKGIKKYKAFKNEVSYNTIEEILDDVLNTNSFVSIKKPFKEVKANFKIIGYTGNQAIIKKS